MPNAPLAVAVVAVAVAVVVVACLTDLLLHI